MDARKNLFQNVHPTKSQSMTATFEDRHDHQPAPKPNQVKLTQSTSVNYFQNLNFSR